MLSVHTSACLLLLINVIGVFKQSRRAILFVMISLVLIFSATIYTYASLILLSWILLIFILLILAYRRSKVMKRPFRLKRLIFTIILSMLVLYVNHFIISETLYALDIYHIEMDTSLLKYYFWLTILVVVILVGIVAWLLGSRYTRPHQLEDLSRCKSIIETYGGNYLSHLIYSGDKDVFMHEAQQAF